MGFDAVAFAVVGSSASTSVGTGSGLGAAGPESTPGVNYITVWKDVRSRWRTVIMKDVWSRWRVINVDGHVQNFFVRDFWSEYWVVFIHLFTSLVQLGALFVSGVRTSSGRLCIVVVAVCFHHCQMSFWSRGLIFSFSRVDT